MESRVDEAVSGHGGCCRHFLFAFEMSGWLFWRRRLPGLASRRSEILLTLLHWWLIVEEHSAVEAD